ncbi:bifunctional diaminohydroxyphosphoribosylaminopyrimidine deaminase/5-amino-6-(5-phosphoribosylamino)uracil reductase RibD [Segnochrobactraceae bacterium EtOH-i3]
MSDLDRRFLAAALALGRRGAGRTWPNPSVGAILVQETPAGPVVVGRGVTQPGGRPHAEVVAIREAGEAARGATLYVTLEPCAHHGRTGPCAEAIVAAGIGRVVSAIGDPNPLVAGKGHGIIRAAGIPVAENVAVAEAARAHAGHFSRVRRGRPHIALKLAISADGGIGRQGLGQVAISGPEARAFAHGLRASFDAILIGIGTALADDPALTCRLPGCGAFSPVRVVLDRAARLPVTSALVQGVKEAPLWVVTTPAADPDRVSGLVAHGVRILIAAEGGAGGVDVASALDRLSEAGLTTVLVEGGASVAAAMVTGGYVDEAFLIHAPTVLGGDLVPPLAHLPLERLTAEPRLSLLESRALGRDRLVHLWRGI